MDFHAHVRRSGAYLCLALYNIYHLAKSGRRILLFYTVTLLCITTVYMGVALNYAQKQLIDDPTDPDLLSVWPQVVVDSAYSINTWLTDAYLVRPLFRLYGIDFSIYFNSCTGASWCGQGISRP